MNTSFDRTANLPRRARRPSRSTRFAEHVKAILYCTLGVAIASEAAVQVLGLKTPLCYRAGAYPLLLTAGIVFEAGVHLPLRPPRRQ
jgi:hypothetical protein